MSQILLVLAVALTVGAIVFGIILLFSGDDEGLGPAEPDSRAVPLPADRPLVEDDLSKVRFDVALRGYRMAQVDAALKRAAYDIGYKDELVRVLQAEVDALREGRLADADALRRAREAALSPPVPVEPPEPPEPPEPLDSVDSVDSVESVADGQPDQAEPADPADRAEPDEPGELADPDEPDEPDEPAELAAPAGAEPEPAEVASERG